MVEEKNRFVDNSQKLSARSFATLVITPILDLDKQKLLVKKFNIYILKMRKKYNSMFLSNYRESKDISRKRISFGLVYNIINYLLQSEDFSLNLE